MKNVRLFVVKFFDDTKLSWKRNWTALEQLMIEYQLIQKSSAMLVLYRLHAILNLSFFMSSNFLDSKRIEKKSKSNSNGRNRTIWTSFNFQWVHYNLLKSRRFICLKIWPRLPWFSWLKRWKNLLFNFTRKRIILAQKNRLQFQGGLFGVIFTHVFILYSKITKNTSFELKT